MTAPDPTDRLASVTCSCGTSSTVLAVWDGKRWCIPVSRAGDHAGHIVRAELRGPVGVTS